MSTAYATPQASKENTGEDRAPVIITPSSVETASSSASNLSKQRVIFSSRNQEHFFEPVLPANPTPSSDQEPSKSILKKRSYDEFLADDALFTSFVPQRSSTPEPDTEEGLAAYLLSPVTTLVQSVQDSRTGGVSNPDIIEAYCVLTARIRAKFVPAAVAAAAMNGTSEEESETPRGLHPAMQPVVEYIDYLVCAMTRDIARAMEDPLKGVPTSERLSIMGESNAATTLPSPPSSSPSPFDPQGTGKRSGMDEQQVKHARDLCTVSQSSMKFLATLFCFTDSVQAGELFTETQLSTLLSALLAIPLSSPLPTPNSRKTSALSITLLTAFSSLLSSSGTPFTSAIGSIVYPNIQAITSSLRRGIDGELGREGKKGAAADSLRAVIRFSITQPDFFATPFCTTLVPSLVKLLGTGSGVLQAQAGNALATIASAVAKMQLDPSQVKVNTPGSNVDVEVAMLMRACFALRPAKGKGGDVQLTPILHTITKFFQTLNAACASRDAATTGEDGTKTAPNPTLHAAAHMSGMWALTVLSAIIVLTDGCLFRPTRKPNAKSGSKSLLIAGTGDNSAPATTAAKVIRILLDNKRIAIRTAASWAWRAFTWTILREFERMDEEDETSTPEDDSDGEKEDGEDEQYTKHQKKRVQLVRRTFDYMDKGVGVGVICALLVGSAGREDRELRLDLSVEALLVMARRKSSTADALQVFQRLLATVDLPEHEDIEGSGPTLGWDINKLLPTALFDGRLAESDSKSLLTLARDEREGAREAEWADDVTSLTRLESKERWPAFSEIWKAAVKGHGLDDKGMVVTSIVEAWTTLLKRATKPPSELVLSFLEEPPHAWLNIADPEDVPKQRTAHRIVQARFINALWCPMVRRFGASNQMRKLAMAIYDRCLSLFQFGPNEGKLQDVCLELFFVLAEVESSIAVLVTEHENLDEDARREFWTDASKTPATANNEELLRALTIAPFGEPRPFEFTDADWESWSKLWQLYMEQQDDSVSGRLLLQRLFAEQLVGNLLPQEVSLIVASIIKYLPLPIKASMDSTSIFTLINQSLAMAYQSGSMDIMFIATSNLRVLTEGFSQLTLEAFSLLTPALIMWTSDPETILADDDYDLIIGSTYSAILQFIHNLPVNEDTLAEHCELLACITNRITPNASTIRAFHSFWTETYADVVAFDNVPDELRPLLLIMESDSFSQEMEQSDGESTELTIGDSFELPDPETSSSFELSPPPTPPSDNETLEEESQDPLSHVAPASEAPEEADSEQESGRRLARWTGSCEDLSQQVANGTVRSPAYGASKPYRGYAFSFQSPGSPIPGLGLFDVTAGATSNMHPSLNTSAMQTESSSGVSTPTSPYSRKRRSLDDDACTPVKRRKQEKVDSDDDSDDDRTPIRPWFDADVDSEKTEVPAVIPFQPFTKHNLPNGAYPFSSATSGSPKTTTTQRSSKTISRQEPSFNNGAAAEQTFFVYSAPPERNNPSAKRRRVTEQPTVQSPVALRMAQYSDEAEPSSDDAKQDSLPPSDDTITPGGVSPSGIVSPAMATAEAASDESTESPVKAHINRRKRLQESKLRSEISSSSISSASTTGVTSAKSRAHVPSEAQLVDIQARQAMLAACQLMPSLDEVGLKRMSSYLEQMQARIQDELRRKSESDQE